MRPPEASIESESSPTPVTQNPLGERALATNPRARMTVEEVARRLDIGRLAVYTMLEQGIIPAIRLGWRWIVTRHAFETWERSSASCRYRRRGRAHADDNVDALGRVHETARRGESCAEDG